MVETTAKVTHNEVKKGETVLYMGQRCPVMCGKRGIRRMLKVAVGGGMGHDIGDVYVWQITHVVRDEQHIPLTLSDSHDKKRKAAQAFGF